MRSIHGSFLTLLLLFCQPLLAQQDLNDTDRQAIRDIIQAQLDAFQADDAATAFSFASPGIQAHFNDPATFMNMVKIGYQPVYRPKAVFFQEALSVDGKVLQQVMIVDSDDQSVMANYPMQRQTDGSWRIDGCFLTPVEKQML